MSNTSHPNPAAPAAASLLCGNAVARATTVVLELRVRNHPGAMSHITGLFARRAFNLEAIVCVPEAADSSVSRMLLLVSAGERIEQIERQLAKLYDVLSVDRRSDLGPADFAASAAWFDRAARTVLHGTV